jgi:hypothetical protein
MNGAGGAGGLAVYQPFDPKEFFANREMWSLETNDGIESGWRPVYDSFSITFNSDGSLRFPEFWRMHRQLVFVNSGSEPKEPMKEILSVLRSIDQKLGQPKAPNCPVCGAAPGGKHV